MENTDATVALCATVSLRSMLPLLKRPEREVQLEAIKAISHLTNDSQADTVRTAREFAGQRPIVIVTTGILVLSLAYIFLLPVVFERFIGCPDIVKIVLSVLLIAPLALGMGMPFPLGLDRLAESAPDFIPWAWGINGFASVMSAVLATLLAIEFGFSAVVLLAATMYLGASQLLSRRART